MLTRRTAIRKLATISAATALASAAPLRAFAHAAGTDRLDWSVEHLRPAKYYENGESWVHARAGAIPKGSDQPPVVVMTMNIFGAEGSDVFPGVLSMRSADLGETWTAPQLDPNLAPRLEQIGNQQLVPVAASDLYPKFHRATGTLLNIGHTVAYERGDRDRWLYHRYRPRSTVFSIYDEKFQHWRPWRRLQLPHTQRGEKFFHAGAGSVQRFDLPGGDILLPIYAYSQNPHRSGVIVLRCSFDGDRLEYREHGNELRVESERGLGEPSLARFGDWYYLTIRHNLRAYHARSRDGLHFQDLQPWRFDDGSELGSYNTQQHWATHSDGLFLVYTRRGADNDDIFRHRAPLFMAQVDPERRVVIRETEQAVVPKRGARLGNFGVTRVNSQQTWITVAEAMRNLDNRQMEADGSLWIAKILWGQPNK